MPVLDVNSGSAIISLDPSVALDPARTQASPAGFIYGLNVGNKALQGLSDDISAYSTFVGSPKYAGAAYTANGSTAKDRSVVKCMGVVSGFSWEKQSPTGKIQISALVSANTANAVTAWKNGSPTTFSLDSLGFWFYDYAPPAPGETEGSWYESLYIESGATLSGSLVAVGSDVRLSADSQEIRIPRQGGLPYFQLDLTFVPSGGANYGISVVTAPTKVLTKTWGIST